MRHYIRLRVIDPEKCEPGSFRTHDIGRRGHHLRIACRLKDTGEWVTQAYRLPIDEYKQGKTLHPLTPGAKRFLKAVTRGGKKIRRKRGGDYELVG